MDSYQVEYRLQPGCVTVSTNENQMEFFITNPTDEPIIFKNDGQVTVKEYPALGENCRANDPPGFELIFSYGSGDGDLNLAEICRNITVSRVQLADHGKIFGKRPLLADHSPWNHCAEAKGKPDPAAGQSFRKR